MAGNTRGKLKEQLEGVHCNCEWIVKHLDRGLVLIKDYNPKLTGAFKLMAKVTKELDKTAQNVYSQI